MTERTAEDHSLVRSALQGEQPAFAELVSRYQKLVASVAWRRGVRPDDIEDVVSEIFLKLYRNLHHYRPEHRFSTWLYRLAVNHVVDHRRRRRREQNRGELPRELADPGPGPAATEEQRERRDLVRRSLDALPTRYREPLLLVYVEEQSVEETATILGLPTGTVKTRLMRGRELLRRALVRRHGEHFGG